MSFLSLTRLGIEASLCPYAWLFTQVYRKDPYPEETRQNHVLKQPAVAHPGQRPDKEQGLSYEPQPPYTERQAGRELEQPAYRYDASGYPEQFARNYDPRLRYDDRLLTYEEQWPYYDDKQPYQPRPLDGQPPAEPTERGYFPRFEEPVSLSYEGRAHYDPVPRTSTLRHEEPPAPAPGYDVHGRYRPDTQPYSTTGPKVPPEPKPYLDQYSRSYEPVPAQGFPSRAEKPQAQLKGVKCPEDRTVPAPHPARNLLPAAWSLPEGTTCFSPERSRVRVPEPSSSHAAWLSLHRLMAFLSHEPAPSQPRS